MNARWRVSEEPRLNPCALALHAALAAEAAAAQDKFWPMHDALLAHQDHLKAKQLHAYAEQVELDMPRYEADMKGERHLQRIREHIADGQQSGVRGTPAFFLNGTVTDASFGLQHLFEAVERLANK